MPAKKSAAKVAPIKTAFDHETGTMRVVLPGDQQALVDEFEETGVIPEGYNFTPHNPGQPFTKQGEDVSENISDNQPPA